MRRTARARRCCTSPARERPEPALAAIARARAPGRPTLLVVDDADRGGAEVRAAMARARRRAARARLASTRNGPGGGGACGACDRARPSRWLRWMPPPFARSPSSTRPRGAPRTCRSSRSWKASQRRAAARVHARRERVGAAGGGAARRRGRGPSGGRARAGNGAGGRAGGQRRGPAIHARALRACSSRLGRRDARPLPVQGARQLRRRGLGVLLRARAARRGARRAARRSAAARRSSAPRAAASHRRCGRDCCPPWPVGCCREATAGRRC